MKKLKHFRNGLLLFAMLISMVACNNNNEEEFYVDADAVFIKKKINDEIVMGVAYYAYGNKSIESATVTLPVGGGTKELVPFESFTYTFVNEPQDEDFSTNFPIPGSYVFDVNDKNGNNIMVSDEQEFSNLSFAEIDSLKFDEGNSVLYIHWSDVTDVGSYVVRLYKLSGEMIFNGFTIGADSPKYNLSHYYNTGSWTEAPVKGQKYKLRIQSIKYDSGATNDDYIYNIQEVSVTDQEITWELNN